MADILISSPGNVVRRYADQEDGTWAEVIESVGAGGGGGDASAANQTELLDRFGLKSATPGADTLLKRIQDEAADIATIKADIAIIKASNAAVETATEAIQVEAESEDNSPVEQKGGRVTSWFTLVTDDAALAIGDIVATAALDITNFFTVAGEVRRITGIQIIDPSNFKIALDIYLMDANQSMGTVNAAPTITAANMEKCMAMVPLDAADYTTQTSTCARGFTGKERECTVAGVGTSLWVNAVVRAAVTYGAIDLRIRITSEPA